jgi:hypothetical protein
MLKCLKKLTGIGRWQNWGNNCSYKSSALNFLQVKYFPSFLKGEIGLINHLKPLLILVLNKDHAAL